MKNTALLQAVIERPDDDAPRLAYADWLNEQGDVDRAEFIRLQCALEQMPDEQRADSSRGQRERQLLAEHAWSWAEDLGTGIQSWVFRRGFIERVDIYLGKPAAELRDILGRAPIRHVRDTSQTDDLSTLVEALPYLDQLTGLEYWGLYVFKNQHMEQLLQSPHLRNLQTLILHHDRNGNLVSERVLADAMQSPYRANLRELAVNVDGSWRGPSPRVVLAMARSTHLTALRKLNLSKSKLGVRTIKALRDARSFQNLEELDLGGCRFQRQVWDQILRLPWLLRLRWLRLNRACIIDANGITVSELRDVADYREAFESSVDAVDWETDYISPYDGNCWQGFTWKQRPA